ncbi:MAG: DUF983 domain-containing protein [Flavobacteriaceae bacterium]|nr:DUF983 domain-containing protein [Flavobacteriaceae bacterium]
MLQKIKSIFTNKCPRCQEGEFFKHKATLNLSKIIKIHDNCPHCDLKYMMEPSFFFGAMYVSYGITVGTMLSCFIIAKVIVGLSLLDSFIFTAAISVLTSPINLRLSRIIWINMFVSYNSKYKKRETN